jgi:hypothetical protein
MQGQGNGKCQEEGAEREKGEKEEEKDEEIDDQYSNISTLDLDDEDFRREVARELALLANNHNNKTTINTANYFACQSLKVNSCVT